MQSRGKTSGGSAENAVMSGNPFNARVKGTVCPVCAEREVLAWYNDLATTDSQLLSEWDYEQNKLKPTEVSRTSAKRAWWKCRHGHSWSMKINERTILIKAAEFVSKNIYLYFLLWLSAIILIRKAWKQNLILTDCLEFRLKHTYLQKSWLLSQEVPMRI